MYFYQGSKSQSDKVNDVWETYFSELKKEKCFMELAAVLGHCFGQLRLLLNNQNLKYT